MSGFADVPLVPLEALAPITTLPPIEYLEQIFARQRYNPLQLTPTWFWRGDSATDLVQGAVLTPVGTASIGVVPLTAANLQSNLVAGIFAFPGTGDSLDAAVQAVMEIGPGSALLLWVSRMSAPAPSGAFSLLGKREIGGATAGYEAGINDAGQILAAVNGGAGPLVIVGLNDDESNAAQPSGIWRVHAMLVDALGGFVQVATDRELGPQVPFSGDLTVADVFSLGMASNKQALDSQMLLMAGYFGPQVEGKFSDVGGSGANLRDNICQTLAEDTCVLTVGAPLPE